MEEGFSFVDSPDLLDPRLVDHLSWGASLMDHTGDGLPDLFVGGHYNRSYVYRNQCGSFTLDRQMDQNWGRSDRHNCAWGEANGDGLLDLVCARGGQRSRGGLPSELWIQDQDGTFTDQAAKFGIEDATSRTRTVSWIDYDADGDLDLFFASHWRADSPNQLFRNDSGYFSLVEIGLEDHFGSEGAVWSDWNRDGYPDLIVTAKTTSTVAYLNQRGHFFSRTTIPKLTGRRWLGATFADLNGDGWPDLHVVKDGKALLFLNDHGKLTGERAQKMERGRMSVAFDADNDSDLDLFVVRGAGEEATPNRPDRSDILLVNSGGSFHRIKIGGHSGNGDSAAAADWDRDGDIDIFVTNGYRKVKGPFQPFVNRSATGNWAGVYLEGGPTNPMGFGARIRVRAGRRSYWREQNDGVGYRSQSETGYFHLGLDRARTATVKVVWPDGTTSCGIVPGSSTITLHQNSDTCP